MERIDVIERLCKSLSEATGERPSDEILAEMLVPSLDIHTLTELDSATTAVYDALQKENIRRAVGRENYEEVREFILKRHQQEILLQPIVPRKMDVSNVEAYGAAQAPAYAEAAAYWPTNAADVPTPPTPDWEVHDLDAMRRKCDKDQGKDKKKLQCHNCGGFGHPFRLCTSVYGAMDKPGPKCDCCGGVGHVRKDCPSEGGGKYKPPEKGKGSKGGDKGKGKGLSNYFKGKGSGVSSLEQGEWSPAEWDERKPLQQPSQQQPPQHPAASQQPSPQPAAVPTTDTSRWECSRGRHRISLLGKLEEASWHSRQCHSSH